MVRVFPPFLLLSLLAVGLCLGCGAGHGRSATRAELRQAFERAPRLEIQLADGPGRGSVHLEAADRGAQVLGERCAKQVEVNERIEGGSMDVPRIVFGAFGDPGVAQLVTLMGLSSTKQEGPAGAGDGRRLTLRGEDPERPGQPLVMHLAADWQTLLAGIENLAPPLSPGTERVTARLGRVELNAEGEPLSARRAPAWTQPKVSGLVRLRRARGVSAERALRYQADALRVIDELGVWYGAALEEPIDILCSASPSEFRELAGHAGFCALEDLPATRLVLLAPLLPDDAGAGVARWAGARLFGPTHLNWVLDGAALDAADRWWGQELVAWGQWLAVNGLLPSLKQLTANASVDRISQHQLAPARGLFFRFLRSDHDSSFLRAMWDGRESLVIDQALEQKFRAWLLEQPATPIERISQRALSDAFQAGIALDSNAAAGGGFDGPRLSASLAKARAQGANSVSITSFYTERAPLAGARVPAGRESLEGDVAIAYALANARAAGLSQVSLQPHLLLSPSAGYSSWQRRTGREHWAAFFDEFDPALVHYGLLAKLTGVDLLCIGTRIARITRGAGLAPEVKAYFDQRFNQGIDLVRSAFDGALTYAAEWKWEAAHFDHWQRFDYIGLSLFWTGQHGKNSAKLGALRARWNTTLETVDDLSRDLGKPVLVMETGVRSVRSGTQHPRVGSGPLDLDLQERYWQALCDTLAGRRARGQSPLSKLAGLYAWKWGAAPSTGGEGQRGFRLQGKPAALQLSRLSPRH